MSFLQKLYDVKYTIMRIYRLIRVRKPAKISSLFFNRISRLTLVLILFIIANFYQPQHSLSIFLHFFLAVANGNASATLRETTADGLRKRLQVRIADFASIVIGLNWTQINYDRQPKKYIFIRKCASLRSETYITAKNATSQLFIKSYTIRQDVSLGRQRI